MLCLAPTRMLPGAIRCPMPDSCLQLDLTTLLTERERATYQAHWNGAVAQDGNLNATEGRAFLMGSELDMGILKVYHRWALLQLVDLYTGVACSRPAYSNLAFFAGVLSKINI